MAIFPTRVIIYPFAHKKLGKKLFSPIVVELEAGSILMFDSVAHAGWGQWWIHESLIRTVASLDDLCRFSLNDCFIRYQCHVSRIPQGGSKGDIHKNEAIPDTSVRATSPGMKNIASHLHFDLVDTLLTVRPPVWAAPMGLGLHSDEPNLEFEQDQRWLYKGFLTPPRGWVRRGTIPTTRARRNIFVREQIDYE